MSNLNLTFALLVASSVVGVLVIICIICLFWKRCPLYRRIAGREHLLEDNPTNDINNENDSSSGMRSSRPISWSPPTNPFPNEPPPRYTRRPKPTNLTRGQTPTITTATTTTTIITSQVQPTTTITTISLH